MNVCNLCKERFMCDRLLYECPREEPPSGNVDELDDSSKKEWAETYLKAGYNVPEELQKNITER